MNFMNEKVIEKYPATRKQTKIIIVIREFTRSSNHAYNHIILVSQLNAKVE